MYRLHGQVFSQERRVHTVVKTSFDGLAGNMGETKKPSILKQFNRRAALPRFNSA
jgi:hypothetical protein